MKQTLIYWYLLCYGRQEMTASMGAILCFVLNCYEYIVLCSAQMAV